MVGGVTAVGRRSVEEPKIVDWNAMGAITEWTHFKKQPSRPEKHEKMKIPDH